LEAKLRTCPTKKEKLQMPDNQHYRFLFLRTFCAVAAMVEKQIFDACGDT
jgi:hypothetical protein